MDNSTTPKTSEEDFLVNLIDCQSRLASFIYALVMDEEVVQDILQETNLVLWRKADEFRDGSFWAWASQVARFKVQIDRTLRQAGSLRDVCDRSLLEAL